MQKCLINEELFDISSYGRVNEMRPNKKFIIKRGLINARVKKVCDKLPFLRVAPSRPSRGVGTERPI